MKVKKVKSGKDEKQILLAMIVDDMVCSRISSVWKEELFASKYANLVGGWCINFYNKYGKAPRNAIERLYDKWAQKSKDKETAEMVDTLLSGLSKSHNQKNFDAKFELDHAEEYFNKVRLKRSAKRVAEYIDEEDTRKAYEEFNDYSRLTLQRKNAILIGKDWDILERAFSAKNLKPYVQYKGALKKFMGPFLSKNSFIAFIAPDKRGKSFWLLDVAFRAWMQGKRVAYFDTGDMTDEQVLRRIGSRCSGKPYRKQKYRMPVSIRRNKKDDTLVAKVAFDEKRSRKSLTLREAKKSIQACQRKTGREPGSFRLICAPAETMSVADIRAQLIQWKNEEKWQADVVVIDYADLLAAPSEISEYRHQINRSWAQMRAISQELDCGVLTATQANAASYKSELMGRWNFSEDKRKLAHVTGMIGINANMQEQERGIQRLNWIVLREGEFHYSKCVHVANCLAITNPAVKSSW